MMHTMIVNTTPVPKGRPRFYGNHAVTPEKTRLYEALIRDSWTYGMMDGPLGVRMLFVMPIPKSLSKKKHEELLGERHTKKPDLDNLVKAVLDGLNGTAFEDDSRIHRIMAIKEYGDEPRVVVTLTGEDKEDELSGTVSEGTDQSLRALVP